MNLALLIILGCLWGSSYLFIKVTVAEVPALTLVAGRLTLATTLILALLWLRRYTLPRSRAMWRDYFVMGLLNTALPYTLIAWGEQHISSGLAALLTASMPIFTLLLNHFFSTDERITRTRFLGVAVGFIGVGVLLLPDLRAGVQASLWGQLAVVGGTISYGSAVIYARQHLRGQPALVSTAGQLTSGMLLMLPLSLLIDRPFDLTPSASVLASWAGLAVLGTVIAYTLYFVLIARTNATFVSMVTYIIPVSGLALGALVLDEPLSINILSSLALVLVGVILVRS